jgi:hypothetical protein
VVQRWSDIYRDHGEYILTGVGVVWGKGNQENRQMSLYTHFLIETN